MYRAPLTEAWNHKIAATWEHAIYTMLPVCDGVVFKLIQSALFAVNRLWRFARQPGVVRHHAGVRSVRAAGIRHVIVTCVVFTADDAKKEPLERVVESSVSE